MKMPITLFYNILSSHIFEESITLNAEIKVHNVKIKIPGHII